MKVCCFLNPKAGSAGSIEALRAAFAADSNVALRELSAGEDLASCVAAAVEEGFDRIAVAGGDGTVHAAVNGLLTAKRRATLGIIPLGTGNDLCRTLAIPFDPLAALALLTTGRVRSIDAIRVEGDRTGYLVNAATGGFSGQVASQVSSEQKAAWGPLAYLRGAVEPLTNLPRFHLTIRFDGGPVEQFDALNVVIANGRTAAGGINVAPGANPEDGLFDVVIVPFAETFDLTLVAARLLHGDYLGDENVLHRLARRVEISSVPPMTFSFDGELCEGSRFTFEIVPKAISVVVGPDYRRKPAQESKIEDEWSEETSARPMGVRERLFGLLAGVLLVVKRMPRSTTLGLVAIAILILVFGWVTQGAVGGRWQAMNEAVLLDLRTNASPELDQFALFITWFGGGWGLLVVGGGSVALFVWRKHYLTAGTLLASVAGLLVLEGVLKPLFALARPSLPEPIASVWGYSYPSGHAMRAIGIYGLLAILAALRGRHVKRAAWWLGALLLIALTIGICWSRVYLGVHWLTDVIAGALAAATWVATCLIARRRAVARSSPK